MVEIDHYVGMLIELASAAIVRRSETEATQIETSEAAAAVAQ